MTARPQIALQQHALSAAFPSMSEGDLEALAEDIKKHGQREAGLMFEGAVLDGWHRYLACQQIGAEFWSEEFTGDNPVAFVLSKNLHRRHLTASQRAAAVVSATNWRSVGRPDLNRAPGAQLISTAEMAEAADVSERTIKDAKVAQKAGLGDEVKEGKVSAKAAAAVANLPKAKREKAVKAIKDGEPPPKTKKSAGYAEKLEARMKEMADELAGARESLAEMADLAASAKAFEEKTEFKEMQVLRLELRSCKRRRDELMAENGELKKEVVRWRKKAGGK